MIYSSTVKTLEIALTNLKFFKEEYIDKNLDVPIESVKQMNEDLNMIVHDLEM